MKANVTSISHKLAERLRERIRKQSPGSKLPAEADLQSEYGASINKVREALTMLAQEGLLERRQGSGTYVADIRRTKSVGIYSVLDLTHPQVGAFQRAIAHHVRGTLRDHGLTTQLYLGHAVPGVYATELDCPNLTRDLEQRALSGLVVLSCPTSAEFVDESFLRWGIPVVGCTDHFPHTFHTPDEQRVLAGLRYLMDRGCRRLALLGWADPHVGRLPGELLASYREAIGPHATLEDRWVRWDLHPSWPGSGWEELREIWSSSPEKPDGLMITDDCLLPDAVTALRSLHVDVPGRLEVAALTNAGISPAVPFPMACVEIDPRAIAEEIVGTMLCLIGGQPVVRHRLSIEHRLIVPVPYSRERRQPDATPETTQLGRTVS